MYKVMILIVFLQPLTSLASSENTCALGVQALGDNKYSFFLYPAG